MKRAWRWWWFDCRYDGLSLKGIVTIIATAVVALSVAILSLVWQADEYGCNRIASRLGYEEGDYDTWAGECFVFADGRWQYPPRNINLEEAD